MREKQIIVSHKTSEPTNYEKTRKAYLLQRFKTIIINITVLLGQISQKNNVMFYQAQY